MKIRCSDGWRTFVMLAALVGLLSSCVPAPDISREAVEEPVRIVGYYASWRNYPLANLDAGKLTHLNYAFANVINGRCSLGDRFTDLLKVHVGDTSDQPLRGTFHQLQLLKEQYPHLSVLISVGGWTWSGGFSDAALTEESRQQFVQSCIDLFIKGEFGEAIGAHPGIFDGIDIDWEYPVQGGLNEGRIEDRHNFTLLLAEFRRQLDTLGEQTGQHYLLTVALGAAPQRIEDLEVAEIEQYLDFANLMTYDFHGGWDDLTNFNAPLYASPSDPSAEASDLNVDAAVRNYLEAGLTASKLVVGVPFYGRAWSGVGDTNHGLYQPAEGSAVVAVDYADIVRDYLPTYERFFHPEAQVPWLYNGDVFVTYDDPQSINAKAAYIRENHLGGVMIWELTADLRGGPSSEDTLLNTLVTALTANE